MEGEYGFVDVAIDTVFFFASVTAALAIWHLLIKELKQLWAKSGWEIGVKTPYKELDAVLRPVKDGGPGEPAGRPSSTQSCSSSSSSHSA